MQGIIVYERENIKKNARFIELFITHFKALGVSLTLVALDELTIGVSNHTSFLFLKNVIIQPDFAVVRLMHPVLSMQLEALKIPCFNSALLSDVANDKRKTAIHFLKRGLPFIDTAFVKRGENLPNFTYPVVVKASCSCGGRKVYLAHSKEETLSCLEKMQEDTAIIQPFLNADKKDVRLYMLNGTYYMGMQRFSHNDDFRSNFGIHQCARPFPKDETLIKMAEKAIQGLSSSLVGVDFLFDQKGMPYLNEIEDAVGTRMLYEMTDKDVVKDYAKLIFDQVRQ